MVMRGHPPESNGPGSRHRADILAARRQVEEARADRKSLERGGISGGVIDGAPNTSAPPSIPGYTLQRKIHRGGQGVIFEAVQESTKRRVAIKTIHGRSLDSEIARTRFERETRILARLNHPHIVTIHDSGLADGQHYFVMDFVDGVSLDQHVRQAGPDMESILRLFVTICEALHEAHVRGIIHRDLKPSNILVDERGQPKILDFGLAKLTDDDEPGSTQAITITGQFFGSLPWASPEQAEGRWDDIDVRSDVYALGVILYQVLTGQFPYNVVGSIRDVLEQIVTAEPTRPSRLRASINNEIETIALKCLSKTRAQRYQSARELALEIQRHLDGQPIEAKRNSSWYLLQKMVRRHRVPAMFAGLAVLLVMIVLAGLGIAYRRESHLRAVADGARQEAEAQADIAQAVNDFLNRDLLAAVQPDEQGTAVSMRQVLDVASERIEGQFAAQPLVEAAIRETLGNTYMELGDWTNALHHAERSLALRRRELGVASPESLSAMNLVGRLDRRLGRLADAEAILVELVDVAQEELGKDHEITTKGMNNLAYVLSEWGRYEEALALNERVLASRRRVLGDEHPDTLTSLNNQAFYFAWLDRNEEAAQTLSEVLAARRRVLPADHPETSISIHNLAWINHRLQRWTDAEALYREALEVKQRVYGERHPQIVLSQSNLGELLRHEGRFQEAESHLLSAMAMQESLAANANSQTVVCLMYLAALRRDQERWDEAESFFERALAMRRELLGNNHLLTLDLAGQLGHSLMLSGRFAEAESVILEALEWAAQRDHPHLAAESNLIDQLIKVYEAWEQPDRALIWRARLAEETAPGGVQNR